MEDPQDIDSAEALEAFLDEPFKPRIVAVVSPDGARRFHLRELHVAERDRWEAQFAGRKRTRLENVRARLIAACLCTPAGEPLYLSREQIDKLGWKGSRLGSALYDAAAKLNGITEEDAEELAGESDAA